MLKTICIMCPMGCELTIDEVNGAVVVTGNTCPRGKKYGEQEYTAPRRVVTSLADTDDGGVVSVKTADAVPKEKVFGVLKEIAALKLKKPVHIGDIAIEDVCGTGVNVVATADKL